MWGPSTAALLAYAAAHGFTVFRALSLFTSGLGRESWHAEGGMLVVAGLAAALVYDNALIASGRFLKQARAGGPSQGVGFRVWGVRVG